MPDNLSNNSPILSNGLSDNEVIKVSERCVEGKCQDCSDVFLCENALDLINRLKSELFEKTEQIETAKAEKQNLEIELQAMRGAANSFKAENERLKNENKLLIDNDVRNKYPNCVLVEKGRIYTKTLDDYDELIADISFEAIKEFAERLEDRIADRLDQSLDNPDGNNYFITDVFEDIKHLLAEMESEQE
jgi:HPt (histidine-containing phosphotransfer) domain-containing protein